jgi:hypothetical protein
LLDAGEAGARLLDRALVAFGLTELGERHRVVEIAFQLADTVDLGFEAGALAKQLLSRVLVVPKVGVFRLGVQFVEISK